MKTISLKIFLVAIGFCFTIFAQAQNGSITGVVIDGDNEGAPMYKVRVKALNTLSSVWSDSTGTFVLKDLPAGTYTVDLKIFKPSYRKKLVTDVVVVAGQDTKIDVTFGTEVVKLSGSPIKVSLNHLKTKDASAELAEQQKDTKVTVKISKDEITKKGASNVSAAVKLVSGVSLENGKYANIRGLNDRYTKTLLNGAEIPGLDANRNAVQLDMFPTAFLQSLDVVKTFSPDLPGDFTGGLIDIKTAKAPDSLTISLSMGTSYNTQVHGNSNVLNYEGSKTDWLGYDNGARDINSGLLTSLKNGSYVNPNEDITVLDQEDQALQDSKNAKVNTLKGQQDNVKDQNHVKGLGTGSVPLNHKINFTIGNSKVWKKRDSITRRTTTRKLGYFAGVNYSRKFSAFDTTIGRRYVYEALGAEDLVSQRRNFAWEKSKDEVLIGIIGGLEFSFNAYHKVGVNFIRNQSGVKSTTATLDYIDDSGNDQFKRVHLLNYFERNMNSLQLYGNHKFRVTNAKLKKRITSPIQVDWILNGTKSKQDQPDLRNLVDAKVQVNKDSVAYQFLPQRNITPSRFWRFMNETNYDQKIHFTIPLTVDSVEHKVKFGASYTTKSREYEEHGFDIDGLNSHSGDWNELFTNENLSFTENNINEVHPRFGAKTGTQYAHNLKFVYANNGQNNNNYTAEQSVLGLYAMTEAHLIRDEKKNNKLDFVGGVRYEATDINVVTEDSLKGNGELSTKDFLPSVNFIYSIWNNKKVVDRRDSTKTNRRNMKVRLSYNKTLARPTFREISPYNNEDFILGANILGNPELNRSLINNYDFRWEYYPRAGELFSVAFFYKDIKDPIAQIQNAEASNLEYTWENLQNATIYGTEIEARKKLDMISRKLRNFDVGFNLTLSKSISKLDTTNLRVIRTVDANRPSTQPLVGQSPYLLNVSLGYDNKKSGWSGTLIYNVFGKRVILYNSDGTPDIYELPVPVLDFGIKKKFSKRFSVGFRAKNIINPFIKQAYVFQKGVSEYDKYDDEYLYKVSKRGRRYSVTASYKF